MNVTACLVTRGDVDMQPVIDSIPPEWEIVLWDNSGQIRHRAGGAPNLDRIWGVTAGGLSVYGRYAAIEYASHDLIYVQDDDVIVSDPQAIMNALTRLDVMDDDGSMLTAFPGVVCNMPPEFRVHYDDAALVGFGAAFHRDAPRREFDRFMRYHGDMIELGIRQDAFWRECDRVFTTLTPRVLVDVPRENREFADGPDRLYRQDVHAFNTRRFLDLARQVRDA